MSRVVSPRSLRGSLFACGLCARPHRGWRASVALLTLVLGALAFGCTASVTTSDGADGGGKGTAGDGGSAAPDGAGTPGDSSPESGVSVDGSADAGQDSAFVTVSADDASDADAGTPACVATGSMATARIGWGAGVTALGGKVLVAGGLDSSSHTVLSSAEMYDPATGTFSAAGTMSSARARFVLIALPSGQALALGGVNDSGAPLATADLYDPASGTWLPTGTMVSARADFGAVLLVDGRVLVVGGDSSGTAYDATTGVLSGGTGSKTAEIYDPTSGLFSATGNMTIARNLAVGFGVSRLPDNDVLVVSDYQASAELYQPTGVDGGSDAGVFTSAGNLPSSVNDGIDFVTTLGTGKALVLNLLALSQDNSATAGGAALFDPASVTFTAVTASPIGASSSAIQLADGDVFLVGGEQSGAPTAQTELYQTATGTWLTTGNTTVVRHAPALANLSSGSVLVLGGCTTNGCGSSVLASAEICSP